MFRDRALTLLSRTAHRIRLQPSQPAVRAGVVGAAVSVAGSFARGLLPRSATDQGLATAVTASVHYLLTATSSAAAETVALYASGDHTVHSRRPDATAMLATDIGFVAGGLAIERLLPPDPDEPLVRAFVRFGGHFAMMGGAANIIVTITDEILGSFDATTRWRNRSLLLDATLGAGLAYVAVASRRHRAKKYGLVDPERRAVETSSVQAMVRATGIGVVAGVGLLAVAATEQFVAHRMSKMLARQVGSVQVGSPYLGHSMALALFGVAGIAGFTVVKKRVERGGDVVEAAYPEPPTSPHVTAGPKSSIPFDSIGKEGRRFVLMALTEDEISAVMGEPAIAPVRVVGGFEAARTSSERAELCLADMDALGAFDRSVICVASPTGVGYVSYVFAETLEYLTRGDCAIVMPQYALVPSALALGDTGDGAELQRLVLAGISRRLEAMDPADRPTVVQFGESLGAQVALDVSYPNGTATFADLGVDGGLYLGVPFRALSWNAWIRDSAAYDPDGLLVAVSEPDLLAELPAERTRNMRHLAVVHHDDPVNKFGYLQFVRPPWWMGRPDVRPPKVPREVLWRPVTTFLLTLIDLKNGMQFAPGTFVRRGHDYRIDTVDAVEAVFRLPCTPEQHGAIERALRDREVDWARRRLVARKFAAARNAINATLKKWGMGANALDSLPDFDQELLKDPAALAQPFEYVVADRDPTAA